MSTIKKLKPEEYSEDRKRAMQDLELQNKPSEASKASKASEVVKVEEPDKKLIADIVKLYAKYYERARVQTIMFYWELGARVNKKYGKPNGESQDSALGRNVKKGIKGASKLNDSYASLVKKLRELEINITPFDLRQARRFAVKYPQIQELIKQQNITWNKIRRGLVEKKKEIESKSDFNNAVIKNFKRWDKFVNEFYDAIPKIDFSKAKKEEKQKCIKILKGSIKKLQKRVEELENE